MILNSLGKEFVKFVNFHRVCKFDALMHRSLGSKRFRLSKQILWSQRNPFPNVGSPFDLISGIFVLAGVWVILETIFLISVTMRLNPSFWYLSKGRILCSSIRSTTPTEKLCQHLGNFVSVIPEENKQSDYFFHRTKNSVQRESFNEKRFWKSLERR